MYCRPDPKKSDAKWGSKFSRKEKKIPNKNRYIDGSHRELLYSKNQYSEYLFSIGLEFYTMYLSFAQKLFKTPSSVFFPEISVTPEQLEDNVAAFQDELAKSLFLRIFGVLNRRKKEFKKYIAQSAAFAMKYTKKSTEIKEKIYPSFKSAPFFVLFVGKKLIPFLEKNTELLSTRWFRESCMGKERQLKSEEESERINTERTNLAKRLRSNPDSENISYSGISRPSNDDFDVVIEDDNDEYSMVDIPSDFPPSSPQSRVATPRDAIHISPQKQQRSPPYSPQPPAMTPGEDINRSPQGQQYSPPSSPQSASQNQDVDIDSASTNRPISPSSPINDYDVQVPMTSPLQIYQMGNLENIYLLGEEFNMPNDSDSRVFKDSDSLTERTNDQNTSNVNNRSNNFLSLEDIVNPVIENLLPEDIYGDVHFNMPDT
jgi:hypothetical protein